MEPEKNDLMNFDMSPYEYDKKYSYYPMIAGILLIFTGILSILGWILFMRTDESLLVDLLKQIQVTVPSFTMIDLKNFISVCSLIGIFVAIFPILGGILSFKKKLWGITLTSSIIGLFGMIPIIILIFIPFISMILLIVSKKEFNNSSS